MQKRISIIIFTACIISCFFGCSPVEKIEYDDVLMPINTVNCADINISPDADNQAAVKPDEADAGNTGEPDKVISETPENIEASDDEALAIKDDIIIPGTASDEKAAETEADGFSDTDIPVGEDDPELEETEEDPLALLPDDGFSYDLSSGIIYDPEITYTPEDIEALYNSDDRFAPFKALAGKKIEDMTDDEFAVLAPTSRMSFEELVGDSGVYNGYPKAFPFAGTYKLVVDLRHQIVMVYVKDRDGEYTIPIRYMKCSSGGSGNDSPDGLFKMRDYRVRYALFKSANCYAQYWSLIVGRIYFHSILYSSLDASTYTETSYNNLGKAVSHGCIRLCVPDARWIWYNIAPDTPCEIKYGTKEDTETIAIKERLKLAELPGKRPALKMGEIPWTDNWTVEEVPQEQPFVNGSQD